MIMKKLFVVVFSGSLLSISFFNLSSKLFFLPILVNLSKPYVIMRVVLVTILISYAFIPHLRLHLAKNILSISGLLLVSLGVFSVISPGLLGHLNNWILLGDSLTLIEGGILAIVLSLELPYRVPKFLIGAAYLTRSLFKTISKKISFACMFIYKSIQPISKITNFFGLNQIKQLLNDITRIYEVPNKAPP